MSVEVEKAAQGWPYPGWGRGDELPLITFHMRYTVPFLCYLLFLCRVLIVIQWSKWHSMTAVTGCTMFVVILYRQAGHMLGFFLYANNVSYGFGPSGTTGQLGLPFEDLVQILAQALSGCVCAVIWFDYRPTVLALRRSTLETRRDVRVWGCAALLAVGVVGVALLLHASYSPSPFAQRWLYLGTVLVWAGPALALEWAFVGPHIMHELGFKALIPPLLASSSFWWLATYLAVGHHGQWTVNPSLSIMSLKLFSSSFPIAIEEFIFVTLHCLVCVLGIVFTNVMYTYWRYALREQVQAMRAGGDSPVEAGSRLQESADAIRFSLMSFGLEETSLDWTHITDVQTSYRLIRQGSKSFHFAALLFPQEVREAIFELYGFCRVTDDMVDGCERQDEKLQVIALLQAYLDGVYVNAGEGKSGEKTIMKILSDEKPPKSRNELRQLWNGWKETFQKNSHHECEFGVDHSNFVSDVFISMRCMERTILRFHIRKEEVQELLDGYKWDAEESVMETHEQLLVYCQCVASSVGVMCCRIFGISNKNTLMYARDMGIALQLTNIARDIITDAGENRVYIPLVMLNGDKERKALLESPQKDLGRVREIAMELLQMAEEYYYRAETFGIPSLPRSAQVAVLLASKAYWRVGEVLRETPVYPKRAYVPLWQKFFILFQVLASIN